MSTDSHGQEWDGCKWVKRAGAPTPEPEPEESADESSEDDTEENPATPETAEDATA